MKLIILKTLIIVSTLSTPVTTNAKSSKTPHYEQLASTMGYPYKLLINRTDTVKIIYSESNENIYCKVIISWNGQEVQTSSAQTTKEKFNDKPLANCLTRKDAKLILARTFD